ncbi:MAG TPA: hypothetical protein VF774_27255, partial [Pseudoduganella sp.]
ADAEQAAGQAEQCTDGEVEGNGKEETVHGESGMGFDAALQQFYPNSFLPACQPATPSLSDAKPHRHRQDNVAQIT